MSEKNISGNLDINADDEIREDIGDKIEIEDNVSVNDGGDKTGEKDINPLNLRVKSDPQDISPDDRKRNIKKLAGAISHALRSRGEINVRAFGNAAIGKAAKALAIAKDYIGVQNLQLSFAPAFITTKIGEHELTGICFSTFASEKEGNEEPMESCKNVLMVKADPKDISSEDRKKSVKKLAGAIAHSLEENKEVVLRCFGNSTIGKASKALAIARGYTATRGPDLYCWDSFIIANMQGNERTGIAFYVYTNEI